VSAEELPLLDPTKLNPPMDTRLVTDDDGLDEMVAYLRPLDVIGYDIETNVTEVFTERKVRTIQLGDRHRQYVIDLLAFAGTQERMEEQGGCVAPSWARNIVLHLSLFLETRRYLKVGQNLSFEHETILWNLGVSGWHYYDTMLAEKILHCGEWKLFGKDIWGLKDIVARYYKKQLSKGEQKGFDLCTPLRQEQVQYAGMDIRVPIQVRELQMHYAERDGLTRATQIENDAIPAFCTMKINGLPVDSAEWLKIVEANEEQHRKNVAALDPFFIPYYGTKDNPSDQISSETLLEIEMRWRNEEDDRVQRAVYRKEYQAAAKRYKERVKDADKWEGEAAVNYGSDSSMLEALRKMGYKIAATNEKILAKIKTEPVIVALLNYRETAKALSTYGRAYLDSVNPKTGRIHSSFQQLGAETGRTSSTRPNVQQLPPENRKTVKARRGYVLITSDMSGAELRIMAELSGDPLWIEMFRNGWDVHSVLAEMIYGDEWLQAADPDCKYYKTKQKCICKKHKKLRDYVKAINFGIAYGMSEYALAPRLGISIAEAKALLTKWKEINHVLAAFLSKLTEDVRDSMCSRTMSGFRRKFMRPTWEWAKEIAIERMLVDKGHRNVETRDIAKVLAGAWGSIQREAMNTPVQGSNAAIAKLCMGCAFDSNGKPFLFHVLKEFGAYLLNFVHDEFVIECPAGYADECREAVKDCIRRAGAEFMKNVVMEAEANVSERWEK
jgi:DNA polymerase-1